MAAKVGDIVRFLNDVGGGRVSRIEGNIAYVTDEDGFDNPVQLRECVVVKAAGDMRALSSVDAQTATKTAATQAQVPTVKPKAPEPAEEPIIETAEGDSLNIVLGFEAHDLLHLSQTAFDAYLVNDSNYFLYFTLATRSDDSEKSALMRDGIIEPNYQLLVGEFTAADLAHIDRISLQIIAFKRGKDFALKAPIAYESRFEASKFARLHCFRPNPYFDAPVIAYDVVVNDVPQKGTVVIEAPQETISLHGKPAARPVTKRPAAVSKPAQKNVEPLVVDLHIDQLIDNTTGLSNADMLNYQIDKFRQVMDANRNDYGRRIVFIHGKGEGVLRQALIKELNYRYKSCSYADASFREYGYGATQVTINKPIKR